MKDSDSRIAAAIAGFVALAISGAPALAADDALVHCAAKERCYGVSKAGKNDCATTVSVCAGTAKQDFQQDAWVYVPKGTCEELAGGLLQPPATAKN